MERRQDDDANKEAARNIDATFSDIVAIIRRLREPDGCPWDREQTIVSALADFKDEVAELEEGIKKEDWHNVREELGDILWNVIFMANIAREQGLFDMETLLAELKEKIIRRHPHVFGDVKVKSTEELMAHWRRIKQEEQEAKAHRERAAMPRTSASVKSGLSKPQ